MGALVSDGGNGVFPADIHLIGNVNVIVANPNCGGIVYNRGRATHELVEFPGRPYMNKERGFFVVPEKQVREIKT